MGIKASNTAEVSQSYCAPCPILCTSTFTLTLNVSNSAPRPILSHSTCYPIHMTCACIYIYNLRLCVIDVSQVHFEDVMVPVENLLGGNAIHIQNEYTCIKII